MSDVLLKCPRRTCAALGREWRGMEAGRSRPRRSRTGTDPEVKMVVGVAEAEGLHQERSSVVGLEPASSGRARRAPCLQEPQRKSTAELCRVPGSVLPDFLETLSDVIWLHGLRAPSWGVETWTSVRECPGCDR